MGYDFRGRVAIVTGASSGIGRAICADISARGATVVGVARRKELLDETIARCPGGESIVADVSDRAQIEEAVRGVLARHGRIDLLVNNAGIPMRIHAARLTVEDVERVMAVNFNGAMYTTLAALPSMIERKDGRIVNISSGAGRFGSPRESAYTASKFALVGWSEVLAADLQGSGVRVHVVHPGPIRTEIWDLAAKQEPPAYTGKFYPPERVARAVLRVIDRDSFEAYVPWTLRIPNLVHTLALNAFIRGLGRYGKRGSPT